MGAIIGEGVTGEEVVSEETTCKDIEGKEVMASALEELVPKEGVTSPIAEGATLSCVMGVDGAPTT